MLVLLALVAVAFFAYDRLQNVDPSDVPNPPQVVVPNPPDVEFNVPNPVP